MKVTMPEELVIVDMEGFYHFPWGRGKLASRAESFKMSTENLKELFPGTDFRNLKPPEKLHPAVDTISKTLVTNADAASSPNAEKESLKGTDGHDPTEKDEGIQRENSETVKMDVNADTVGIHGDVFKRVKGNDVSGKEITAKSGMESNAIDTGSDQMVAPTDSGAVPSKSFANDRFTAEADENNKSEPDISMRQEENAGSLSGKGDDISENSSANPDLKFKVYKHGSSEILLPHYEVVFKKELSQHQQNIASRTLLSLRRSDEEALEEIRIFNAQDNFVVNSCAVFVKLKGNEKISTIPSIDTAIHVEMTGTQSSEVDTKPDSSDKSKQETSAKGVLKCTSKKGKEKLESDEIKRWEVKKEKLLQNLYVRKEKIKKIWDNLQQILPFQVSIIKWILLKGF